MSWDWLYDAWDWVTDAWDATTDWIRDNIVKPVVDWVKDLIEDTAWAIRVWRHEFHKLLAKWLENDFGFLALIAVTITLAILWPKIVTWVGKLSITIVLKEVWKEVEEGWVEILDFIHIVELDAINTIVGLFWPSWKAMTAQLMDVTSSLAAELGKGTEYLHAYFSVLHGIAIVENSFLGTDARLAEMQAFEDTSAGLQKIDDKFWDYAENPALIVPDIIDNFYLPRAENIGTAQQDLVDSARDSRDKIVTITESLHDFESRLTRFIEITPEGLQEVITDRLQPVADALSDVLFVMDTEIMPKVDGVIAALDLWSDRQNEINANVIARMDDPYSILVMNEFLSPDLQLRLEDYLKEIGRRTEDREVEETMPLALEDIERASWSADVAISAVGIMPSLAYEPAGIKVPAKTASERERDWYVGEW